MIRKGKTTKVNPKHIYIVGFFLMAYSSIVINDVFFSNSSEYDTEVGLDELSENNSDYQDEVEVYNILGIKVKSRVKRELAKQGL